jgi:hypothetical protein
VVAAERSYSTGEPRGSETHRKNGQKTKGRWTSSKSGNGSDVAAKSDEGTADSGALGDHTVAEEYEGVFGGFESAETHAGKEHDDGARGDSLR